MSSEIFIAILAFLGSVVGAYSANSKNTAVMQEQIKDVKKDISTLSGRVDKYNNLVERMIIVEQSTKSAHHRLDEIKEVF